MNRRTRPLLPLVALPLATLVVASCGDDGGHGSHGAAASSTAASLPGGVTSADVDFVTQMIPHHQQAVEMADLALAPAAGASPQVVELATAIAAAQQPEIDTMSGWLSDWGVPMPMAMDGMDGMEGMTGAGMMTADEMTALAAATGAAFDTLWLQLMVRHHQGAIDMAAAVRDAGTDPDVAALAEAIIAAQQAEIDRMNALLAG